MKKLTKMKIAVLTLTFSFILISCKNNQQQPSNTNNIGPNLTVLVYDISVSTDKYAVLEATHLNSLYHNMGFSGGGKVYGILIQTNSQKQDPITQDVPILDTLPLKGNAYQQQNRRNKNKELLAQFENSATAFAKVAGEKMLLPKDEKFSDVQHALELAKNTLENPQYSNYVKQLIIISDMENDFPPKDGIDRMQPVQFRSDVNIAIVRPSGKVNLLESLGGAKYTVYTTIDDAINGLFHH